MNADEKTEAAGPILVIGATGKTGSRVAERLEARGLQVRAGTRNAEPPFDWEDQATWAPAFEGTSAAYISFYPDIAVPGTHETIAKLSRIALDAGTKRLVLLSGRGEEEAERAEAELAGSGADWTVVRCSWFMQNFSEGYFRDPVAEGNVALPADGTVEPFVDVDDIADVAVAALTEDGHLGKVYELTGPRMLTFADAVGEIAKATGREISYTPISIEDFASGLAAEGVPDDVTEVLAYLFTEVLDGRNEQLADGVKKVLGPRATRLRRLRPRGGRRRNLGGGP